MPPGPAPTRACSSTPPSTSGTPARRRPHQRVSNPCSEYMFLDDTACNLASLNLLQVHGRERAATSTSRPTPRLPPVDDRARDLGADGAVPEQGDRELSYEYRTLGLGYANIGGLLMLRGHPLRLRRGRAICGGITAIMTGASLRRPRRDGRELGPFPGYARNREHMLRVIRNHRRAAYGVARGEYEGLSVRPAPLDQNAELPGLPAQARRPAWDARCARRAARLPQRPGHGHRAHRHHRPRDGLRHHRHRARLRAGEVQEARRRRLLQDHQPVGAPKRCAPSATAARRSPRSSPMRRPRHPGQAPGINHATLRAKGFTDDEIEKIESELAGAFDIKFVFNRWTLGDDFCRDALGSPTSSSPTRPSTCSPPRLLQATTSRPPTTTSAAR
jgi:ribonucleoside-diphosphate reductase alpha chain